MTRSFEAELAEAAGQIEQKQFAAAEELLRRCLMRRPDSLQAKYLMSCLVGATGRIDEAIDIAQGLVAQRSDVVAFHLHLVELYRHKRNYFDALRHAQLAMTHSRGAPQAAFVLGAMQSEVGQLANAVQTLKIVTGQDTGNITAALMLGRALLKTGRFGEAEVEFQRALALDPSQQETYAFHAAALFDIQPHETAMEALRRAGEGDAIHAAEYLKKLGELQEQLGDMPGARVSFEAAFAKNRASNSILSLLVSVADTARKEELAAHIQSQLAQESVPPSERAHLHYTMFAVYDAKQQVEVAFDQLVQANAILHDLYPYDEAARLGKIEELKASFSRKLVAQKSGMGCVSDLPIFVLGMPRSGSTLIEQVLASHPLVAGGGELSIMKDLADSAFRAYGASRPYPSFVAGATGEQLRRLGELYAQSLSALHPGARRITDKLPANFIFLGLIHLALPRAKIILTMRQPLDICFSCFSMGFFDGFFNFSNDLGELGRYYRAFAGLIEHWKSVLPEDAFLIVRYEDVVRDFEGQVRRILSYCELPWDPKVLEFQKASRQVATASVLQVRQPIYTSSISRAKKYEKFLGPLIAELGDLIEN